MNTPRMPSFTADFSDYKSLRQYRMTGSPATQLVGPAFHTQSPRFCPGQLCGDPDTGFTCCTSTPSPGNPQGRPVCCFNPDNPLTATPYSCCQANDPQCCQGIVGPGPCPGGALLCKNRCCPPGQYCGDTFNGICCPDNTVFTQDGCCDLKTSKLCGNRCCSLLDDCCNGTQCCPQGSQCSLFDGCCPSTDSGPSGEPLNVIIQNHCCPFGTSDWVNGRCCSWREDRFTHQSMCCAPKERPTPQGCCTEEYACKGLENIPDKCCDHNQVCDLKTTIIGQEGQSQQVLHNWECVTGVKEYDLWNCHGAPVQVWVKLGSERWDDLGVIADQHVGNSCGPGISPEPGIRVPFLKNELYFIVGALDPGLSPKNGPVSFIWSDENYFIGNGAGVIRSAEIK